MATPALALVPWLVLGQGQVVPLLVKSLPCLAKTIPGGSQVHNRGSEEWQLVAEVTNGE